MEPGEPELLRVEPFVRTLGEPEPLRVRTFIWNLQDPEQSGTFIMWNLEEPGARFRAAAPNHPEALLEEPQAFQAVGQKHFPHLFRNTSLSSETRQEAQEVPPVDVALALDVVLHVSLERQ